MTSISCSEMREIDKYAIEALGIPSIILMENAALKLMANLDLKKYNNFLIVCGVGNNGGDGFALARHLFVLGKEVKIFLIGDRSKQSEDSSLNLKILLNLGIDIREIKYEEDLLDFEEGLEDADLVIDGIFGTGLRRKVEGIYEYAIRLINESDKYVLAIDIPSGLNGDDGSVCGLSVFANKTITFHLLKHGHLNNFRYTGELIVVNIGIPNFVTEKIIRNRIK